MEERDQETVGRVRGDGGERKGEGREGEGWWGIG
jgi:hypothetical protein